jgi:membrane protein DedA with SNARE-associated domain
VIQYLITSSSYLGVFVVLVLASLGLPVPEAIPIATSGILAHRGVMGWKPALAGCCLGVLAGDPILYTAGRRWGEGVLDRPALRRVLTPERRDRLAEACRRHGALIVFTARHLMGLRTAAFLTAGIVQLPAWKFLLADGIGIVVGVSLTFGLAYFFADHVSALLADVRQVERWLELAAVVGVAAWLVVRVRRRRAVLLGSPPTSAGP